MSRLTDGERNPYAVREVGARTLLVAFPESGVESGAVTGYGFVDDPEVYVTTVDAVRWHRHAIDSTHGRAGDPATLKTLEEALTAFTRGIPATRPGPEGTDAGED